MKELETKTIREIALEFPQTTRVFEEFKIDYCCGGRKSLEEACGTAGIDAKLVNQQIEELLDGNQRDESTDFPENLTPEKLIDHIIEKHHVFTNDAVERLTPLMEKVARKHGSRHPELLEIEKVFRPLAEELTLHMKKEEKMLFPYIKVLAAVQSTNLPVAEPHFKTVKNPVRMMMFEHDTAGFSLKKIREFSNDYALPADACPSFTALYFGLEELEKDLHRHIHLENNVLFPQALELEDNVLGEDVEEAGEFVCQPSCG
jgi:regulator of cell morphogenesis and NO signaling